MNFYVASQFYFLNTKVHYCNFNSSKMNVSMYKIEYVHIYLKENDRNAELMAYAKWLNSNEIGDCQMIASMNSCGILDC